MTPRVLCLSFDPHLALTRALVLQSHGYEVDCAGTIEEMVRLSLEGKYDAVVLCHSVDHDSRQALIRQLKQRSSIPVVAMVKAGEPRVQNADFSVGSLDGPEPLLRAVAAATHANGKNPSDPRLSASRGSLQ